MRRFIVIPLFLAFCQPFLLQSQSLLPQLVVTAGPGSTQSFSSPGSKCATLDAGALLALRRFAIKAGALAHQHNAFGVVHNVHGLIGFTTKVKRRISIHLLSGLGMNGATVKPSSDSYLEDGLSLVVNPGLFILPTRNKRFVIGLEGYLWRQTIYSPTGLGKTNEVTSTVTSLALSMGFRL